MKTPYGAAFNTFGEMFITEHQNHQVAVFDVRGLRIRTFGSLGATAAQMRYPKGIAVCNRGNVYIVSNHKLQKFTGNGELVKCIGQKGSKEGEFNHPRAVTLFNDEVYVCDCLNHRIQVFDIDLNFIKSIGSHGKGNGEFKAPNDLKFDKIGNIFVVEYENSRVQVLDQNGLFIRQFGKGHLSAPSSLHIFDDYVYVGSCGKGRIVVFDTSGQFITSFGKCGRKEGEFRNPYCITSCAAGFIHVCDYDNNRVQIF